MIEDAGPATVVRLEGEIDRSTQPQTDRAFARASAGSRPVVLDATGVTFMDASGASFLLRCADACRASGREATLLDPPPCVQRLLDVLDLTGAFTIRSRSAIG